MTNILQPFHLLLVALAGWLYRHQQAVIDYLNRTQHGQEYAKEAWHRTCTRAKETYLVEDFLESTLGGHDCHGFFYS